jgi:sec-independent protein translocase protein TatA
MLENRGLEIIILAVIVLLLFGAKRLPDTARAQAEPVAAPKTIQAAPGESATARPVADAQPHVQS